MLARVGAAFIVSETSYDFALGSRFTSWSPVRSRRSSSCYNVTAVFRVRGRADARSDLHFGAAAARVVRVA